MRALANKSTLLPHPPTGGYHLTFALHPNAVRVQQTNRGQRQCRRGPSSGTAIALSNNRLLLRHFTFDDDDDPGPLSVDWVPLEHEFGAEVGDTFEGLEMGDSAAALSKDGVGKFSSSTKSYWYHQMVVSEDEEGVLT